MKILNNVKLHLGRYCMVASLMLAGTLSAHSQRYEDIRFLSTHHSLVTITQQGKYLLLPVEEKAEISHIKILMDNNVVKTLNVKLAQSNVDYYVPVDLSDYQGKPVCLDIHTNGEIHSHGALKGYACWKLMKVSDTFDTTNREKWRPLYRHTPVYGWMNDPNGMFYKDGVYHLYYQYNPYGSQWENMTWRHSTSRDLINWTDEGVAIAPDALGTIFSGSSVVDHNNTAGFGKGAIVAFYTSAGESQTQSMAYSTDNGKTFKKYDRNPILTSNVPDFRDPKVIWHRESNRWVMVLAVGQEMQFFSSTNLKDWTYESSFGKTYGNHDGVWECPDLMKLPVRGTNKEKWMLICNINPGGPFGGSATQYFIGDFDGKTFTCEDDPAETKWMDYGKDHYAAVTFDNAPDGRHILMAWMSNWQYANQVPTKQYRSANAIPCDLDLFEYKGETYVGRIPSKELMALRGKVVLKTSAAKPKAFNAGKGVYEVVVKFKATSNGKSILVLSNKKGERVEMVYDMKAQTLSVDRTKSGETAFSNDFGVVTTAPVPGTIKTLRIFVDKSSVEVVDAEGKVSLTNIVFPNEPYNHLSVQNSGGCKAEAVVYGTN